MIRGMGLERIALLAIAVAVWIALFQGWDSL
jgi:hypothetical protein